MKVAGRHVPLRLQRANEGLVGDRLKAQRGAYRGLKLRDLFSVGGRLAAFGVEVQVEEPETAAEMGCQTERVLQELGGVEVPESDLAGLQTAGELLRSG